MMNNKIILAILTTTIALLFSTNSFATELKTSSLSMVKTETNGKIPQPCQQLFKEGEKLISEAARQPGTHIQVKKLQEKLSSSKQKILKMDHLMQQKSCDKGLIALNTLKKKY